MMKGPRLSASRVKERWMKPPEGILKVNCDGSFSASTKAGGWGFVIRDCDGDVVVAGRGRIDHLFYACQAEIIAYVHGVQAAVDQGIGNLIVETDAVLVK